MKFEANNRRKAIEYEKDLVRQWKQHKTFEKSVEQRSSDNAYVFYDGPPFITGVPHTGTLLASVIKDAVPRYQTMRGKRVERVWGWDCHGLPAEVFTEKKLDIQDRRDIGTKISLEQYITTCRDNMVATGSLWEDTIDRIGRWVDFKGAYSTMDKNYMESVWWAFQKLYNDGKIYEGERVLLYCTRDATPLSKAEVTMDAGNYKDVNDPSVYVKFQLTDWSHGSRAMSHQEAAVTQNSELRTHNSETGRPVYLLAWTTTPWTLPANTAVAVHKDANYSQVELEDGTNVILATELLKRVLTDEKHNVVSFTFIRAVKGAELVGKSYEPLFEDRGEQAHKVWHADYVTMDSGTGIVHLAPAYGEEDYALSKQEGFPFVSVIDENGFYSEGEWTGQNVWEANKPIAKELHGRGVVWKVEYMVHSYPHCYRCGTRLMYRAHPSWFMDIAGQRGTMVDSNEDIGWFPEHLKEGRFRKNIEAAPDWNLSRDRFWATAMPVWKGTDSSGAERIKVVGSYAELKELSGVELEDYHRPWVDDIEFDLDGVHYTRIDKVMDCWFESGSMPFAQFHYPFENKDKFEASFPGDFIVEYIGQVRAWFYYVHAVSIGLFGEKAYKQVIGTGTLAGNDGRKMSKSYGNYTDPNEVMDLYSADALRLTLLASPVLSGEDFSLQDKHVQDIQRKLAMIWNMYDFFTLYASVDQWEWNGDMTDPLANVVISTEMEKSSEQTGQDLSVAPDASSRDNGGVVTNALDKWVLSRLHQLQQHVSGKMDVYDIPGALELVLPFLDDASNWYVRRSRRRFWKSGDDSDKDQAYRTLHYVLVRLSIILAPFTPFLSEELYQKLTGGESVHLLDWPKPGAVNETVLRQMAQTREFINQGLSQRAANRLKVRQPLTSAKLMGAPDLPTEYCDIVAEELNVKRVEVVPGRPHLEASDTFAEILDKSEGTYGLLDLKTEIDTELTPELKQEGLMRELIRQVQTTRKAAGLNVDDRIELAIVSDDEEVRTTLVEHAETVRSEALAVSLADEPVEGYSVQVSVEGHAVSISLAKA